MNSFMSDYEPNDIDRVLVIEVDLISNQPTGYFKVCSEPTTIARYQASINAVVVALHEGDKARQVYHSLVDTVLTPRGKLYRWAS